VIAEVKANHREEKVRHSLVGIDVREPMKMLTDPTLDKLHILVSPKNQYGFDAKNWVSVAVTDAFLPLYGPAAVSFEDRQPDEGKLSGEIEIEAGRAADDETTEEFAIYFGRSSKSKLKDDALSKIGTVASRDGAKKVNYSITDRKVPAGATHILVLSKNKHGELDDEKTQEGELKNVVSMPLIDVARPCSGDTRDASTKCPAHIERSLENQATDADKLSLAVSFKAEKGSNKFSKKNKYALRLSATSSCHGGFKTDYLDVPVESLTMDYKNAMIALTNVDLQPTNFPAEGSGEPLRLASDWKYIIVYTRNEAGLSKFCSIEEIKQKGDGAAKGEAAPAAGGAAGEGAGGEKKAEL